MEPSPAIQLGSQLEDPPSQPWYTQDKNFFDNLERAGGIPAARRFKTLGMWNLLILQTKIQTQEKNLQDSLGKCSFTEELDVLMAKLRDYNHALLEQRQVLSLPEYNFPPKNSYNKSKDLENAVSETDENQKNLQSFRTILSEGYKWKEEGYKWEEDLASLDPCSCLSACPPKGIDWLLTLPTQQKENKLMFLLKLIGKLFLVGFLAVLPAASILVLYVIRTSHKRLWAILGETVFLACALAVLRPIEKDILAYMLAIAAVQVIFVGSVIGSS